MAEITNQQYPLGRYGLHPRLPETLDSSMLSDYANCPSLFYHRHVLGQRLKHAESAALDWGSKWHEVMFVLHHEWNLEDALAEVAKEWPRTLHSQDPKNRTQDRMRDLLIRYIEKYRRLDDREFTTHRREEFFEIECPPDDPNCPFSWKGCGLKWCGRIDRIVERTRRKRMLVWDYKTTSWMRASFFDELRNGFQIRGYVWAASHLIRNQVLTAFIDVLHTIKNSDDFHRREERFSEGQIYEWLSNVKAYQSLIQEMWEIAAYDPEAWHKNWNNCDRFSGCAFKPIHYLTPIRDTRLRVLEEDYVEDRWNPAALVED